MVGSPSSRDAFRSIGRGGRAVRVALLWCGLLAAGLNVFVDVLGSSLYPGYRYLDQAVSELSAVGAPTRPLLVWLDAPYVVLLALFAVGVWMTASKRSLRVAGVLLGVEALLSALAPLTSMNVRGAERTLGDVLHLVATGGGVLVILTAMGFAAVALGRRFGVFTVVVAVAMIAFGAWSVTEAGRVAEGLPTPWLGLKERASYYMVPVWLAGLSVVLLRRSSIGRSAPRRA